jgi:hypothetical protein
MTPLALLGFPSVDSIVHKVVSLLFGALSQALLPDFLRDGTVEAIKWLIAVPNPANAALWPNVARLEHDMAALGFGLLGLVLVIATIRYTFAGATGTSPLLALSRTVGAAAGITLYHWAFQNLVALVNVVTNQILAWPVVSQGLGRTVKVLFGGSLLGASPTTLHRPARTAPSSFAEAARWRVGGVTVSADDQARTLNAKLFKPYRHVRRWRRCALDGVASLRGNEACGGPQLLSADVMGTASARFPRPLPRRFKAWSHRTGTAGNAPLYECRASTVSCATRVGERFVLVFHMA